MRNFQFILLAFCGLAFCGCSGSLAEDPGSEYMPDMGHSVAYEANYYDYYRYNRWGTEDEYHKMAQPRQPIKGTIPRGYAGVGSSTSKYAMVRGMNSLTAIAVTPNGSVPYYYKDTEEERTRAMNEIIQNPFLISEAGLDQGAHLYDIFCGVCHGKKGDGNGLIYDTDANPLAKYPAAPANLISEEFVSATNGRYYHAIMHGKNVMGGYADKLSYEERWQVIHHIRSLQAKATKTEYSQNANTLGGGGRSAGANYVREVSFNGNANATNISPTGAGHSTGNHGGNHNGNLHMDGGANHGGSHGTTTTKMQSGTMQSGVKSTTQMQSGVTVPGAAAASGKEKKKGFLKKAGEKIKGGANKLKDGTKKAGGKIKGALKNKKKDAGNGGE